MIIRKEAEYGAKIRGQYVVVGHHRGFAVLQDEIGNKFTISDPNENLEEGVFCVGSELCHSIFVK